MDFFRNCQKTFRLCVMLCILAGMFAGCGRDGEDVAKTQHNWLTDDTVISLYQHETGEVIQLPLKEYLYGVVAGEMDVNWPVEALAAQAIMARTFTLEKIDSGGGSSWYSRYRYCRSSARYSHRSHRLCGRWCAHSHCRCG